MSVNALKTFTDGLNISEDLFIYLENNFIYDKIHLIYSSLKLIRKLGIEYFEDELLDIIRRTDTLDNDGKINKVIETIRDKLIGIIHSHGIVLSDDYVASLEELNEIVKCLYLVQNLETTSYISYILSSEGSSKVILERLTEYLTILPGYRFSELVEAVHSSLIEAMKNLIKDKEDEDREEISYIETTRLFFKFIDYTDCLGLKYFNMGYDNVTIDELLNLIDLDVPEYVDDRIHLSKAKVSLDILSLLMICKDSYEVPILTFKSNPLKFANNLETISVLDNIMTKIVNDFLLFAEAEKQKEKIND